MPYYTGVIVVAKTLLIALSASALFAGAGVSAQDASSKVEVMICPDATQSSITVTEPQSDSIVSQPKVTINGLVTYISQIDFFIDNTYNHTLALGYLDTTFASTVTLSPGTHTLKIVATDSCSQTVHTNTIVITYEPSIQPSVGENVETAIDGAVTNVNNDGDEVPAQNAVEKFITTVIAPPFVAVGKSLDIIPSTEAPAGVGLTNVVRSFLFVTGSVLAFLSLHVSMLATLPAKLSFFRASQSQIIKIMGLASLACISLVFML